MLDEIADPTPRPGQAVVRVRAAAVNFPDVLMLSGGYQVRLPPPFTPGSEFAGEVLAVGELPGIARATGCRGRRWSARSPSRSLVDARALVPIPDGVDFADAAAFGVTYRTAYFALRTIAGVAAGRLRWWCWARPVGWDWRRWTWPPRWAPG